jgi:signal transduction histidine kinase
MTGKPTRLDVDFKVIADRIPENLAQNSNTPSTDELHRFIQLQVEQLTAQVPIQWVQVTYRDLLTDTPTKITRTSQQTSPFSSDILSYLSTEDWLVNYPPAFTLNQLISQQLGGGFYLCPFSYWRGHCQYLLLFAPGTLSPTIQGWIQKTAVIISEYFNLYRKHRQQQHQTHLLEQIVQRVGHQLRQPLSLINLYAENLCRGLPLGVWQEQSTIIRETAQTLDRNLTELLYCGCGETLRVTLQDLRTLVLESLQGFQGWFAEKQLQITYPDTSILLPLDRLQMKQVFDNLLSNAAHFSPQGGKLVLNWQLFHTEVLLTISDQGPGLSPQDLQSLFTPFYSRRQGGTGLGLAIAQKVVLNHRGNLWAKNLPTGGAEFSMILPRHSPSH